jgi:hypothetical protein
LDACCDKCTLPMCPTLLCFQESNKVSRGFLQSRTNEVHSKCQGVRLLHRNHTRECNAPKRFRNRASHMENGAQRPTAKNMLSHRHFHHWQVLPVLWQGLPPRDKIAWCVVCGHGHGRWITAVGDLESYRQVSGFICPDMTFCLTDFPCNF